MESTPKQWKENWWITILTLLICESLILSILSGKPPKNVKVKASWGPQTLSGMLLDSQYLNRRAGCHSCAPIFLKRRKPFLVLGLLHAYIHIQGHSVHDVFVDGDRELATGNLNPLPVEVEQLTRAACGGNGANISPKQLQFNGGCWKCAGTTPVHPKRCFHHTDVCLGEIYNAVSSATAVWQLPEAAWGAKRLH